MKPRNTLAFNPYMKKSHAHTERLENVKQMIDNDIDDWDYVNNLKTVQRVKTPASQGFSFSIIQYLLILV
jgi:hypothetical protein